MAQMYARWVYSGKSNFSAKLRKGNARLLQQSLRAVCTIIWLFARAERFRQILDVASVSDGHDTMHDDRLGNREGRASFGAIGRPSC